MDQNETKTCGNCKRDIPTVNFTIHSVHCARNIGMCPVCKEPFPHAELQKHHEKMHKLLPCKQCGESVCGTDLEDHIRDSCANTMQTCRYCNLEVRRGEMPAHERYCGARTEQCEECGEWVMLKYRRLHTESNHGFIRLDDDPVAFRRDVPKKVINKWPQLNGIKKQSNVPGQPADVRRFQAGVSRSHDVTGLASDLEENVEPTRSTHVNGAVPEPRGPNERVDAGGASANTVENTSLSRGAIKKRPAPKPPSVGPPPDAKRDLIFSRALQRQQDEEREYREKNQRSFAQGLPPVLNPFEKLERLRKMDALQNRETEDQRYKERLKKYGWMQRAAVAHVLGEGPSDARPNNMETERRRAKVAQLPKGNAEKQQLKLKNLKPMTQEEFVERFNELRMRNPASDRRQDRFSEIKSSLRELRRGLNEVTAPYNANSNVDLNQNRDSPSPDEGVKLPCEFCGKLVPAGILVQHQTGCRPDLACLLPRGEMVPSPPTPSPPPSPPRGAVIPCEFCAESLPVYLISEHQERCGRLSNFLFAD